MGISHFMHIKIQFAIVVDICNIHIHLGKASYVLEKGQVREKIGLQTCFCIDKLNFVKHNISIYVCTTHITQDIILSS